MFKLFSKSRPAAPPARPPPHALSLSPEQRTDPAFSASPEDNPYAAHIRTSSGRSSSSFVVVRKQQPQASGAPALLPRKSAEDNSSAESAESRSSADTVTPPTSADCHDPSLTANLHVPTKQQPRPSDLPLVTIHPSRPAQASSQTDMPGRDRHSPPRADNSSGRPSPNRTSTAPAPKSKALDSIDELDESSPFGVNLHHGSPYEAIRKHVKNASPSAPNGKGAMAFGASLNLKPGQVIPHNFHPYAPYSANVSPAIASAQPSHPPPRHNFFPTGANAPGQKEATGLHRDDPYALATNALQPELPPTTALQRAAGLEPGNGQTLKRRGSQQPGTWIPPTAHKQRRQEASGSSSAGPMRQVSAPAHIPRVPSAPKLSGSASAPTPPISSPVPRVPSTPVMSSHERLPSRTPPHPPRMPHAATAPLPTRTPPPPTQYGFPAPAVARPPMPAMSAQGYSDAVISMPGPSHTPPAPSRTPPSTSRTPPPPSRTPGARDRPTISLTSVDPPSYDVACPDVVSPTRLDQKTPYLAVPERELAESEPSEYGDEDDAYGGLEDAPTPVIPTALLPGGGAYAQQPQQRRWSEQSGSVVGAPAPQPPSRTGVNHGLYEQRAVEPGAQGIQRSATIADDTRGTFPYTSQNPNGSGFLPSTPSRLRSGFTQYSNGSSERMPPPQGQPPMPMPERRDRRVSEPWRAHPPSQYAPSTSTSSSGMHGRPRPTHVPQRLVMPSPLGGPGGSAQPPPRGASVQARFVPPQHLPGQGQQPPSMQMQRGPPPVRGPPPARSHMQHQHLKHHPPPSMQPAMQAPAPAAAVPIARSQSSRLPEDDRKLRKKGSGPPRHDSLPPGAVTVDLRQLDDMGKVGKTLDPPPQPPKKRVLSKRRIL